MSKLFTVKALVVESIFAWPGVGRLALTAVQGLDLPVFVGVLGVYSAIILSGRIVSEFFRWLARLIQPPVIEPPPAPTAWRRTARVIWVGFALALLLMPLAFLAGGPLTDPDAAMRQNIASRLAGPSAQHPWGTDALGRDLQARLLIGAANSLQTAALAALVVTIAGILGGLLTAALARRQTWLAETIADLLLLPADVLLFVPALFGEMIIVILLLPRSADLARSVVPLAAMLVLLPRALRAGHALWLAAPSTGRRWLQGLAGGLALLLGSLFAALWLITGLDFLGLRTLPPTPSLGTTLRDAVASVGAAPTILWYSLFIWAVVPVFYITADALLGFFRSKEPLARLNE